MLPIVVVAFYYVSIRCRQLFRLVWGCCFSGVAADLFHKERLFDYGVLLLSIVCTSRKGSYGCAFPFEKEDDPYDVVEIFNQISVHINFQRPNHSNMPQSLRGRPLSWYTDKCNTHTDKCNTGGYVAVAPS